MPKTLSKDEVPCEVMRNHNIALSLHLGITQLVPYLRFSVMLVIGKNLASHCAHVVINKGEDSENVRITLCEQKE